MEYFIADFIATITWLVFYLYRKDLRKEMLLMSFLATPIAVFDLFFVPTYWMPHTLFNIPIGIEGFIYSFLIGGIAAVGYVELTKQMTVKMRHYHKKFSIFVLVLILPLLILFNYLGIPNIMISLYLALLCGTALTIYLGKDLLKSVVIGGITFGIIYFISLVVWCSLFPEVKVWFTFDGLPKIFILNAPLWEVLFGIFFGAYWGNLFELFFGYKFRKYS